MADSASNPANSAHNSISVFFPCYNEQENIERVYESASKTLKSMDVDYEIILVNDGSTDRTPQIADAIASADQRVKVIHHPKNLGYGAALQSGFRSATKTLVFYTDGDGQFDLGDLPPLMPLAKNHDIISCFRLNRQDKWIRRFNARCWNCLVCLLFGLKLKDINCAFKLFKREVFNNIKLQSTGAFINAEIFALANRLHFAIAQVGVRHLPRVRGNPTGARLGVIIHAFFELLKLYRQINRSSRIRK